MFKLVLIVLGLALVSVIAVRVAVRIIRFVRARRGEVSAGLLIDELRGQFADSLESWANEPSPGHDVPEGHVDHGHAHDNDSQAH